MTPAAQTKLAREKPGYLALLAAAIPELEVQERAKWEAAQAQDAEFETDEEAG